MNATVSGYIKTGINSIVYFATIRHIKIYLLLSSTIIIINCMLYYITYVIGSHWNLMPPAVLSKEVYNRGVLALDYMNSGFVRRGLGGLISNLLSDNFFKGGMLFYVFSAIWVAIPAYVAFSRLRNHATAKTFLYISLVTIFSPQTFLGWSSDFARTDVFVEGCLIWAAISTVYKHNVMAVLFVIIGFLAHETAVIFGVPLLMALNLRMIKDGHIDRRSIWHGALIGFLGIGAIVVLQAMFTSPHETLVRTFSQVLCRWGSGEFREGIELSGYFNISGSRGLRAAICENMNDKRFFTNAVFGLMILIAYIYILDISSNWRLSALSSIIPYISMLCVATDTGRWLKFSVASTCWIAVSPSSRDFAPKMPAVKVIIGLLAVTILLICGPTHVSVVNLAADKLMNAIGLPATEVGPSALVKCDARWRDVLKAP